MKNLSDDMLDPSDINTVRAELQDVKDELTNTVATVVSEHSSGLSGQIADNHKQNRKLVCAGLIIIIVTALIVIGFITYLLVK